MERAAKRHACIRRGVGCFQNSSGSTSSVQRTLRLGSASSRDLHPVRNVCSFLREEDCTNKHARSMPLRRDIWAGTVSNTSTSLAPARRLPRSRENSGLRKFPVPPLAIKPDTRRGKPVLFSLPATFGQARHNPASETHGTADDLEFCLNQDVCLDAQAPGPPRYLHQLGKQTFRGPKIGTV